MDKPEEDVKIEMSEPVSLTFSLKYLTNFCKASGLSHSVKLCLSSEVPLLVEYNLGDNNSYLRFYLAPKVRSRPQPYDSIFNSSRLVTRNKRIMSSLAHERHTFRINVGDLLRNCPDMHRAPVRSMVLLCYNVENAHPRVVFGALGTKGYAPPKTTSRHTAEFQIRKSTVHQHHTPPALLPLSLRPLD